MKKILLVLGLLTLIITSISFALNDRFLLVLIKHDTTMEVRQIWIDRINSDLLLTNPITLSMFTYLPVTNQIGEEWDSSVWTKGQDPDRYSKFTIEKISQIEATIGTNIVRMLKTDDTFKSLKDLGFYYIVTNSIL